MGINTQRLDNPSMRKCETCNLEYADSQLYCMKCGLPTEACIEDRSIFGNQEYVEVHNIKKSTVVFIIIRCVVLLSIAILFFSMTWWSSFFLLLSIGYTYENITHLIKHKLRRNDLNNILWDNVLGSIWVIVFSSFFITFMYYGGAPASDDYASVSNEFYEENHFYLSNKGVFTEVSEETYQWMSYVELSFHIFIVLFLVTFALIHIFRFLRKKQSYKQ